MTLLRAFGRFWLDFLVGDRLELFIGPIVALALTGVAVRVGLSGLLAGFLLLGMVLGIGALSLAMALGIRRR